MIPDDIAIERGLIVRHEEGLLYVVEDIRPSTTGYESTHDLGRMAVNYTQLQAGGYPAGSLWNKDETDFRAHFDLAWSVTSTTEDITNEGMASLVRQRERFIAIITERLISGPGLSGPDLIFVQGIARALELPIDLIPPEDGFKG